MLFRRRTSLPGIVWPLEAAPDSPNGNVDGYTADTILNQGPATLFDYSVGFVFDKDLTSESESNPLQDARDSVLERIDEIAQGLEGMRVIRASQVVNEIRASLPQLRTNLNALRCLQSALRYAGQEISELRAMKVTRPRQAMIVESVSLELNDALLSALHTQELEELPRVQRTYVDATHAYQQTASPDPFGASSLINANNTSEAGGFVMSNRANGAPLPFPSSTVPPPSTTSPSQSAFSYSNPKISPSRVEEGRSDVYETQMEPNVAFEVPFALAIAGSSTSCAAVLSASRGDITALTWSAAFFILATTAAKIMLLQLATNHIVPSIPSHSLILRGYKAITYNCNTIGAGIFLYAMGTLGPTENGGFTTVRGDVKGQRAAAIFTAVMAIILIIGGLALPCFTKTKTGNVAQTPPAAK